MRLECGDCGGRAQSNADEDEDEDEDPGVESVDPCQRGNRGQFNTRRHQLDVSEVVERSSPPSEVWIGTTRKVRAT